MWIKIRFQFKSEIPKRIYGFIFQGEIIGISHVSRVHNWMEKIDVDQHINEKIHIVLRF